MKVYSILILLIALLTACVQSTKKPLIGNDQHTEQVSLINVYPESVYLFELGRTRFSNQLHEGKIPNFNVAEVIEDRTKVILNSINNVEHKDLELSEAELSSLKLEGNNLSYEKKIQNIPNILQKANDNEIDKLLLITPSNVNIYDTSVFVPATGLIYSEGRIIEAYSSVNIYIIDTKTGNIIGKHDLRNSGYLVQINNTLTETEIETVTQMHQDEQLTNQTAGSGARPSFPLKHKLARECTRFSKYENYSKENMDVVKNSLINSLDILFSRLENIYLGTPIKKHRHWRQSKTSVSSCEV